MSNGIVPITKEQAEAAKEIAKTGELAIESARQFVSYWAGVFGTAPHDLFGLLLGDRLHHSRLRNLHKLEVETETFLKQHGVKQAQKVSEDIAVPIVEAARATDREELLELWARLLAAAMDPARSALITKRFIDVLKQIDPLDALVLKELSQSATLSPNTRDYCATKFKVSSDQVEVSLAHLDHLECVKLTGGTAPTNAHLTAFGRTLMGVLNG